MSTATREITEAELAELVRRVVEAVHPLRIILFGSAARGEMTEDSDVDVVVEMPEGTRRRASAFFIQTQFRGLGLPVDVVVVTPSLLQRYGQARGMVYREALQGGKGIYAAS